MCIWLRYGPYRIIKYGVFDGDEMNLYLLLDEKMYNLARTLEPHYNITDLDYFKINGNLYLPSTVIPTISNYLIHRSNTGDKVKTKDEDVIYAKLKELSS